MNFEKISVIGMGYIGLPTAAMFASKQKKVIGVDVNHYAVDRINRGEVHINEPGLDNIVRTAVKAGYLEAVTSPKPADAFIIAVPTPLKSNGSKLPEPDLTYIEQSAKAIAPVLKAGNLVILESTSPVGSTEQLAQLLAEQRPDLSFPHQDCEFPDISVAYCPERVLPGQIMEELVQNDRVIGGMSSRCSKRAGKLYQTFVKGQCVETNARTAELVKLTENSCRDVQIAFANELSLICDQLQVDVWELISLANRHPRINILQPGPGVGGHCIAVDPWFIVSSSPELANLIQTARQVNHSKPEWVVEKVQQSISDLLQKDLSRRAKDITVSCFGLAFKANVGDMRESPALEIAKNLAQLHPGNVLAVEPNADELEVSSEIALPLVSSDEAIKSSDILVLLVDHKEFRGLSFRKDQILIDTKGVWRAQKNKNII